MVRTPVMQFIYSCMYLWVWCGCEYLSNVVICKLLSDKAVKSIAVRTGQVATD